MAKRKQLSGATQYVKHPRYGAQPTLSGLAVPMSEIRNAHWSYGRHNLFPESVLAADISKQNYSMYPRSYYVDIAKNCRQCECPFIFFAREQRYWFETLGFYVDADCVHCPDCRRATQVTRRRLRRYSDALRLASPSRKELMHMVEDAIFLLEKGVLRDLNTLGKLKNRAQREIAEFAGVERLAIAIKEARTQAAEI